MSDVQDTFMLFSTRDDGKIEAKFIGEVVRALGLNPTEADIRRCGYTNPGIINRFLLYYIVYIQNQYEFCKINLHRGFICT